jgi:hypothetical protein
MLGLLGLATVARNPRFEAFHTVDILQLLTSGMCFGIALMALLGRLVPRKDE